MIKQKVIIIATAIVLTCSALAISGENNESNGLRLRLIQCVEAALRNNRDISIERMNMRGAEGDVVKAWADFDPFITTESGVAHTRKPAGSQLLGADVSEQETLQVNFGVGAKVPTGGLMRLDFQNERMETNSFFQDLNPQYSTSLVFSVNQPLLKNFGLTPNLYRVRLARNNRAVSKLALEGVVLQTIGRVEDAYWRLVLAMENLDAQRMSLDLAQDVLKMTQAQVRTGILPPVATLQAEASRASREEGVIVGENSVEMAQRNLLVVINIENNMENVPFIIPIDRPAPVQPLSDVEGIVEEAIRNNQQLRQMKFQLKNAEMARKVSRNYFLPRLDLNASVGLSGLSGDAGDPIPQPVQTGRVIPDPTGASLGILETTSTTPAPNSFDGNYYHSLDTLTSGDFVTWSVGLQFQYSLGNRAARIDYSQAMLEVRKLALRIENTRQIVEMTIRNMAGELLTNIKRVNATQKASELSRRNMEAERKKFQVGISTNRDVLEAQESYAKALIAEIQALVDYNTALGKLERAKMGYLDTGGLPAAAPSTGANAPGGLSIPGGIPAVSAAPTGATPLPAGGSPSDLGLPF